MLVVNRRARPRRDTTDIAGLLGNESRDSAEFDVGRRLECGCINAAEAVDQKKKKSVGEKPIPVKMKNPALAGA